MKQKIIPTDAKKGAAESVGQWKLKGWYIERRAGGEGAFYLWRWCTIMKEFIV